jgi:anthranilate synthase component 1
MLKESFAAFAKQGFNRIPIATQVLADVDTPVSAFLKLAQGPYSYLFESVHGGEKWGRYSILGLPARKVLKIYGQQVHIEVDGELLEEFTVDEPLAYVESFKEQYKVAEVDGLPQFQGGLVGYFAYDTVRYVEKRLQGHAPEDKLNSPDILLMVSEEVVVFDNLAGTLHFIVLADPSIDNALEKAQSRLDELTNSLASTQLQLPAINLAAGQSAAALPESAFSSGFKEADFKAAVERIKDYVLDGDVMQVVISQRLSIDFHAEPMSLYRALRNINPSPYMYYLDLGDTHIVGSSPEILARAEDGIVAVRPIAGTRRRGRDAAEDIALEKELLADPKEISEHIMLIDLGRNDAGKVGKVGTVKVTQQMAVERYSHVMHIVSNVEAELRDDVSALDVLKATLPAGTLSGAPKVRAMEIIDELEPVKRGIYGGAIGYLSWKGNMDTAIAIRTAVIKDKKLHIQAGAGIVADSIPDLEWKETMNKARAIFRAVAMVQPLATASKKENETC